MKYILLDTNILANCTLARVMDADPELLEEIIKRIRDRGAKLLLPDVIRLEYERNIPIQLKHLEQQLERFKKDLPDSLPKSDLAEIRKTVERISSKRQAAAKQSLTHFRAIADDDTITVRIELSSDIVTRAIGYALAGQKPSGKKTTGFVDADCLIVASVATFAESNGLSSADAILLCSDNHTDFATFDSTVDAHVRPGPYALDSRSPLLRCAQAAALWVRTPELRT